MSSISKLKFVALDISGKGYSSWILDVEIHLDAMGLADTIKDNNQASSQDRAKAMIFLRHHLNEGLKMQYLTIKDPLILWKNLKDSYGHLKLVILLQARHDWFNLSRLVGSMPLPEKNQANYHQRERGRGFDHGRGPDRGHGPDRGRGRKMNYNHDDRLAPKNDQQYKRNGEKQEAMQKKNLESVCQRCGGMGHWSRTYRLSKRLVQLYQVSLKKGDNNNPEANFISKDNVEPIHKIYNNAEANFISEDNVEPMHLDVADFFVFPEGKTISDEPAII
ncbi:uncharacterized protein LOC125824782 [Solanum verrucosum]|uniref:uncharacterized protein LOC125824782 n=1 Tax=Solanum verrucosum TaxID=315347 RepID=UPI0020D14E13|nr:uncharacterized protein LOC125824782 [Solanum verrucosum]